ncbi:MAG: hypothetical protein IKJ68_08195 [Clostridia bacterium]|nr:hypothetical protein [Clostridia bacterium]
MIVLKPILICVITLIISVLLKNIMPHYVPLIVLCCGTLVLIYTVPFLKSVINVMTYFQDINSKSTQIIKLIIKIVIIALSCEFASELCSDSGNTYLSSKITFAGKIIILSVISPHIISFMENIIKLME